MCESCGFNFWNYFYIHCSEMSCPIEFSFKCITIHTRTAILRCNRTCIEPRTFLSVKWPSQQNYEKNIFFHYLLWTRCWTVKPCRSESVHGVDLVRVPFGISQPIFSVPRTTRGKDKKKSILRPGCDCMDFIYVRHISGSMLIAAVAWQCYAGNGQIKGLVYLILHILALDVHSLIQLGRWCGPEVREKDGRGLALECE